MPDDPALWTDLTSKLKDGILSAFDARVAQREDESKTMEAMRTLPGWNFCTFFLLKVRGPPSRPLRARLAARRADPERFEQESLAHSFEGMGLFEDALMQYNELEASFFQVLKGACPRARPSCSPLSGLTDTFTPPPHQRGT